LGEIRSQPLSSYINNTESFVKLTINSSPLIQGFVYSGVMEVSIYVHKDFRGKGIGKALLGRLVTESELQGIWTLQAGIFPENHSSIALHEKFGFRKVGYREKIGKMDGIWRDTILMERRSQDTGQA
jgi:L-amino acid N-acyltransferase YncA